MIDCSTRLKHVVNIYRIMRDDATLGLIVGGGRPTPYFVLVECDRGHGHNPVHLKNHISMFVLFLVGNMYKLVATRGCLGFSYLNTSERGMDIINIVLSGLALSIYPNTEEWFLSKVLKGAMSMKSVRNSIEQYETELPLEIAVSERQSQSSKP